MPLYSARPFACSGCCTPEIAAATELRPHAQVLNATGFLAILAAYKGVVQTSYVGMVRCVAALRCVSRRHVQPAIAHGAQRLCNLRAQVIFTAIGFGGNGAMLLPGLVTTLGNFPEIRGMVTGLMKSVFFLCASLYTEVSTA